MTLREVITEKRKEFWKEADTSQMGEELELIIDRMDGMSDRLDEIEDCINRIEVNISMPLETSEPFLGYNDLMEEAIPVITAAIAEKKRELAHRVVPMKVSED